MFIKDLAKQSYFCEFYKNNVVVFIDRRLCDQGEDCPEPQPHIIEQSFNGCSDITNCGVGKIVNYELMVERLDLCPAHTKLDIEKESL